ncbi:MFS transporter [Paracraurococcus lichenis]|uniref:MFS transporter n=1 Tax=Paracraurococcus lichenis TaxID=3064888 RepID=A0ABT9DTA8_9PROT|nr:MFS transporter [Paracraurococcus sp. LOR1-02]MDO9707055.1 MFS transporter [Paracraurococcus sp. LOR1-02]
MPLLAFAYIAFIGLGLPDPLPGTLWPAMHAAYGLPVGALGALLLAVSAGTMAASILAGRAIAAFGTGGVLAGSVALTALAALGAATAPPWPLLVALALLSGLGAGAVDAAMNLFAAARFAPRHLNWMHACWGIGATLSPAIATGLLAAGASWRAGYGVAGAMLAALAAGFLLTRARWGGKQPPEGPRLSAASVLRNRLARLQILAFFTYCGVEAGTGQWLATVLVEARGADPALAGAATTLFWAALAAGRVGLGFVVDRLGPDPMLRLAVLAAVPASAGFALAPAGLDLASAALLAVALAPLYPTLMARTPARLGAAAAMHAVGFQVAAATLGAGLLPALLGLAPLALVPWLLLGLAVLLAVLVLRIAGAP